MNKCYLSFIGKCCEQKRENSVFCIKHEKLKNDRETFINIASTLLINNNSSLDDKNKKNTLIEFFDFATYRGYRKTIFII